MTLVVGVAQGGHVWMAGDRIAVDTSSGSLSVCAEAKISWRSPLLVGVAGDFRVLNFLHHTFQPPALTAGKDPLTYTINALVPKLREGLRSAGMVKVSEEVESLPDSELLVGVGGRLFRVTHTFGVIEAQHGYDAVGTAEDVAIGALAATTGMVADERCRRAMHAGMRHNAFVRGPFDLLSTKPARRTPTDRKHHPPKNSRKVR